jgi:hypothetical protein
MKKKTSDSNCAHTFINACFFTFYLYCVVLIGLKKLNIDTGTIKSFRLL